MNAIWTENEILRLLEEHDRELIKSREETRKSHINEGLWMLLAAVGWLAVCGVLIHLRTPEITAWLHHVIKGGPR